MRIFKLNDAHLDHRPEIHGVLVKMKGCLPGFEYLTGAIKMAQKELGYTGLNSSNIDNVYKHLLSDSQFKDSIDNAMIQQIMNDLKLVTSQHVLQFASAKWNQSVIKQANKHKKSN